MIRAIFASISIAAITTAGVSTAEPQGSPSLPSAAPLRLPVSEIAGQAAGTTLAEAGFEINLAGRVFTLAPTVSKRVAVTGADVVRGTLAGEPGSFVLASVDGFVAGAIWTEGGAVEFRPIDGTGLVEVIDIDEADLPGCLTDDLLLNAPGERPVFDPAELTSPRGEAQEQVVRVLVGITEEGQSQMGGQAAALAIATASIESTNAAFANSEMTVGDDGIVAATIELAGTLLVDGQGLGYSALLDALRNPDDGIMDEIHPMRDATKADLVALLSRSNIGVCGVAYYAINNPSRGFSVTAHSCAVGNLTFAHELGHNYGAAHDAANAGGGGGSSYAFGWRWNSSSGSLRRSVMSYSPGSRRPHFSNPEVTEGGGATGDADQADNARWIGEITPSIAQFRTGPVPPAGDCDGDGTLDGLQIALDPLLDLDGSGTLDTCDVENGLLDDCDQDGVPDILEIRLDSALDSDGSGTLDACDLEQGLLEDCNNDGLADIGQIRPRVELVAEPILFGDFPPVLETTLGGDDEIDGDVTLIVSADADVGSDAEYIDLFISGVPIGRLWELDGADCDPIATRTELTFDAAAWESFPAPRVLSFQRPSAVSVAGCGTNSIRASIEYTAINREFDANGDGVLDGCEPGCSAADLAEPFGLLDLADISAFGAGFVAGDATVDLSAPFGVFDLGDIAAFVTAFTAGCP